MENKNEKILVKMENNTKLNSLPEKVQNVPAGYYKGVQSYAYHMDPEAEKIKQKEAVKEFKEIGIISLIYAAVFVFCLYRNLSAITSPIWAAATAYYIFYVAKIYAGTWYKMNTFINSIIVLLGTSNFITDNDRIIFMNYVAILFLIVINVVSIFYQTGKVNVTGNILLIAQVLIEALGEMEAPFKQPTAFIKERKHKKNDKLVYVIIGIAITIPVLLLITMLLANADEVFCQAILYITNLFKIEAITENIVCMVIMALAGYVMPYIFIKSAKKKSIKVSEGKTGTNEPIIAIIVTTAISVVYVLFSGIQIVYLFMGNGTLPEGYTYAEYAREGFFQLLFVCAFNMILVLVCIEFFRDNKFLSAVLSIVSGCTFIMIASSAYRMGMYIREYGLTFTRVFVLWALVVITLMMLGILYQIYRKEFNLFKYATVVVSVCFLILSFSHIDYFIAKYNLEMYQINSLPFGWEDGIYSSYVDCEYIVSLSEDATPAFKEYWDDISSYMEQFEEYNWDYKSYKEYVEERNKMTLRNFNLSKFIAIESGRK